MTASHEPRPTQVGYQYQQSRPAQFPYQHYPSQQYIGQYHQPGPAPEQFNNRNNKNGDNKKLPTWAKVTAGGLAVAAAVGGGLFAKSQFDSADRAETVATGETLSYEIESPTLSFNALDAQKRFDANIDAANDSVRHGLSLHKLDYGNFFSEDKDAGPSSLNMTPEEIVARATAKEQWIKTNPDAAQARADVDLLAAPGSSPHSTMLNTLSTAPQSERDSTDPSIVIGSPHRFSEGTYAGISASTDTWIIGTTGATRGGKYVAVYEWQQSPDGTTGEWIHTDTYSPTNTPSFATTFADILQK